MAFKTPLVFQNTCFFFLVQAPLNTPAVGPVPDSVCHRVVFTRKPVRHRSFFFFFFFFTKIVSSTKPMYLDRRHLLEVVSLQSLN